MTEGHALDVERQVRTYVLVFVALLGLTLITVAVSLLHLPVGAAVAVALFIAGVKGSLVALYFMHLVSERKLVYWVLGFTVVCFAMVLLVPLFTQLDHIGS